MTHNTFSKSNKKLMAVNTLLNILIRALSIGVGMGLFLPCAAAESQVSGPAQVPTSPLTKLVGDHKVHVFLKHPLATARTLDVAARDTGPLRYYGGTVMTGEVTFYAIYWVPPQLQNGKASNTPASYTNFQTRMLRDYPGHGLSTNLTQYYQTQGGKKTYISGLMKFGGYYMDTSPYPASTCQASITPKVCITDADIQQKIIETMALKGWKGGTKTFFMVYTAKGEDVCDDSTPFSQCANLDYCGYHGYINQATPIIYAMLPYGDDKGCGMPSYPNNLPAAEAAASTASHEIAEMMTDPLLDAWSSSQGWEIADLCDYISTSDGYKNTWYGGKANQMWNGHFYELELNYDNHVKSCVAVGP